MRPPERRAKPPATYPTHAPAQSTRPVPGGPAHACTRPGRRARPPDRLPYTRPALHLHPPTAPDQSPCQAPRPLTLHMTYPTLAPLAALHPPQPSRGAAPPTAYPTHVLPYTGTAAAQHRGGRAPPATYPIHVLPYTWPCAPPRPAYPTSAPATATPASPTAGLLPSPTGHCADRSKRKHKNK